MADSELFTRHRVDIDEFTHAMRAWALSAGVVGVVEIEGAWWYPGLDTERTGVRSADGAFHAVGDALITISSDLLPPSMTATHEVGTVHLVDHDTGSAAIELRLCPLPHLIPTIDEQLDAIRAQPTQWWGWSATPGGRHVATAVMTEASVDDLVETIAAAEDLGLLTCPAAEVALSTRPMKDQHAVRRALSQRGHDPDAPF